MSLSPRDPANSAVLRSLVAPIAVVAAFSAVLAASGLGAGAVFTIEMLICVGLLVIAALVLKKQRGSDDIIGVAENATDVIFTVDRSARLRWANAHARSRFGLPVDAVRGTRIDTIGGTTSESACLLREVLVPETFNRGAWNGEIVIDGRPFAVHAVRQAQPRGMFAAVFGRDITDERDTERSLRDSEAKADAILRTAVDAILTIDERGNILSANPAVEEMFGYKKTELEGQNVSMLMPEPYRSGHDQYVRNYTEGGDAQIIGIGRAVEGRRKDGSVFPIDLSVSEVELDDRRIFAGIARDVTAQHEAQRSLRDSEAKADAILRTAVDAILTIDERGNILSANPAVEEMFGYKKTELEGQNVSMLMPEPYRSGHDQYVRNYTEGGDAQIIGIGRAVEGRRKDGSVFPIDLSVSEVELDDRRIFAGIARDVTAQRDAEAALAEQAATDQLTRLPNRSSFNQALDDLIAVDAPGVAVMFVDVDHFKLVNDTLGHQVGDEVLVAVGQRINSALRADDQVFRQGGDEFLVIARDVDNEKVANQLADRIGGMFSEPLDVAGRVVRATVSVGIALRNGVTGSRADLVKAADLALYRAKDEGRARHQFFDAHLQRDVDGRKDLEDALHVAIDERQLVVHYQPVIDILSRRVVSAEALVRWERPGHGLIPPDDFIQVAEASGLIAGVGSLVLHDACREAASWNADRVDRVGVAVNISPLQIADDDFVGIVHSALAASGLPAELLTLEITESMLVSDRDRVASRLDELQRLGVGISLDDFGTGYSALSYLRDFPVLEVKIDRTFIQEIPINDEAAAMLGGIVELVHRLGLRVVAEGIEETAQHALVQDLGCDRAQGYLWSRPVPADQFVHNVRVLERLAEDSAIGERFAPGLVFGPGRA